MRMETDKMIGSEGETLWTKIEKFRTQFDGDQAITTARAIHVLLF